jgi:aspartyl-tRNA(Asn)/glutamyl-tRNA(Gln) amidotransferase subunit A
LCIGIKSNINVQGLNASCASKTLENYKCPYDASVIEKIKAEDGIIIGMLNMDEFASGSSGETSAFEATQNPSALGLIPGGSSSGSAAAIAAGFCDLALGSDTGGSIRNPASHCGIVGIKPSYSRVSRYGLIDLSMSLDQIGTLSEDVYGAALLLDIISGKDDKDAISQESSKLNLEFKLPNKIKIGIPKLVISDSRISKLVQEKIEQAVKKYKWEKQNIEIKYIDLAVQTYYPIVYAEFFSGTRKFDGRRYGKKIEESSGSEVLRRILGGSEISKAEYKGRYYRKALQVKELIKEEFSRAFEKVDCIIIPTVPRLPHKIGSKISAEEMYNYDPLTIPANLAEICAISIPAGKIDNTPVGMQIMSGFMQEQKMLEIAKAIENLK